ncbi:hypothetical protein N9R79_07795 [Vibrio sp.]|nr:hypothetical protein [Vibrio sp.]
MTRTTAATRTHHVKPLIQAVTAGLILSAGLVFTTSNAHANLSTPSNYCEAPLKPQEFSSKFEVESFRSELYDYRKCVQQFIHSQQEAILNHQHARNEALEELNAYEKSVQR